MAIQLCARQGRFRRPSGLSVACCLAAALVTCRSSTSGQELPGLPSPPVPVPDGPNRLAFVSPPFPANDDHGPRWCPYRFQLFRMPPAFLCDPVDVQQDEDPIDTAVAPTAGGGCDGVGLAVGTQNPFFDVGLPGDPGGPGYFKVSSQYQLFDSGTTGAAFGLQAVAPAGLEANGVASGPTILSPYVACFQGLGLGNGTVLHEFVGQDFHAKARGLEDDLERRFRCGLAVATPIAGDATPEGEGLHAFLEVLGRYRYENGGLRGLVVPGLHWHRGDHWWLSAGLVVHLADPRAASRLVQFTCSWRF